MAFSERHDPFLATVSLIAGGGFVAVNVNTGGIEQIEASIEFGGNFTLDLGIAEGNVHALAGIYFLWRENTLLVSGYVRYGGSVEVLGIIGVSIEVYLSLGLVTEHLEDGKTHKKLWGQASLTLGVRIAFFSKTFSITVERTFDYDDLKGIPLAGGLLPDKFLDDPPFDEMVSLDDWETYCNAFA